MRFGIYANSPFGNASLRKVKKKNVVALLFAHLLVVAKKFVGKVASSGALEELLRKVSE